MEWINAVWRPTRRAPRRILVAGCGTGVEAFALRRRFRDAEIVAVDFSPRSIAAARDLQRRNPGGRRIRFLVADLTGKQFPEIAGGGFDFISCHGVLSYIPRPARVLKNLARCLKPDGALCLGVNGELHFSARGRQFLPAFGFDIAELRDGRRLRAVLALRDTLLEDRGAVRTAVLTASQLAGDLFGPLIHNLPLSVWIRLCRSARLHFLGSWGTLRTLRPVLNNDLHRLLMPRSRAEVSELVETLAPSSFHRLLFSPRPPAKPPWGKPDRLLEWRPLTTGLYRHSWPKRRGPWRVLREIKIKSLSTDTMVELCAPEWELEILRRSSGKRSLSEILAGMPIRLPRRSVCRRLYLLYHFVLLDLLPPSAFSGP
jgi:SAM-dependent methyltransferase